MPVLSLLEEFYFMKAEMKTSVYSCIMTTYFSHLNIDIHQYLIIFVS